MAIDTATYEVTSGVAVVTLNRPDQLNAISVEMADHLHDLWRHFENDPSAQVAILRAEGQAFCAGADIKEPRPAEGIPWAPRIHRCWPRNGVDVFKPIIGAVQGYALGAGYVLAVHGCDITIAGESALFGYPEPRLGFMNNPIEYVPGFLPFKTSLEFYMVAWDQGWMLRPEQALAMGLVNRVVPDDDLLAEASRWAEMLKRIPPLYIRGLKRGHYAEVVRGDRRAEMEYLDFVWPHENSEDLKEARSAYRERREPKFTGR